MQKRSNWWNRDGGFKQLLSVAFPLILSTGSHSVMMFIDRMFLSWYSVDAIAAAVPASMVSFSFVCFFLGVVSYGSTFVAQYMGAGRPERVGNAVWESIRLALIGGALLPLLGLAAPRLFGVVGHAPEVQALEVAYFRLMLVSSAFFLLNAALSGFFSGRGRTWPVMWMSVLICVLNIGFDYALVFGHWGMPRLGIVGAGLATIAAAAIGTAVYALMVFRPMHERVFATRSGWRFDRDLFMRIVRFGTPSGVQFWLSITGFAVFMLLVGRIGKLELVASNVALQINLLGVLPMVGMGIATTILVGRFQGARRSDVAVVVTRSALVLCVGYAVVAALFYLGIPDRLTAPFLVEDLAPELVQVAPIATTILQFMAVLIVLDSVTITLGGALKGAGDTRFVMLTMGLTSAFCLVLPAYVSVEVLQLSIDYVWSVCILNLGAVALAFAWRFRSGRWMRIEVIEREGAAGGGRAGR